MECTGDEQIGGIERQTLGCLHGVGGDPAEDTGRRLGMDRAHRSRTALAHGIQHGKDLVAQDLAHDHPVRIHPQRAAHQVAHRDLARPLHVGRAGLEGHQVGMPRSTRCRVPARRPARWSRCAPGDRSRRPVPAAGWSCPSSWPPTPRCSCGPGRRRRAATGGRRPCAPMAHRSSSERSAKRCRRIDTAGRAATAITADRRAPPGNWRSSSGRAMSNRRSARPNRPAAKRRRSTSSSSESATGSINRFDPSANVAHTRSHPLMSMFSMPSSSTSGWRRPRPNRASRTDWARRCSSSGDGASPSDPWR